MLFIAERAKRLVLKQFGVTENSTQRSAKFMTDSCKQLAFEAAGFQGLIAREGKGFLCLSKLRNITPHCLKTYNLSVIQDELYVLTNPYNLPIHGNSGKFVIRAFCFTHVLMVDKPALIYDGTQA